MRYILHYTKPGDIVFDGFSGTGMTGVAAQMCGCSDSEYKYQIEQEMPGIEWGTRKAILSDLSPVATFIAQTYHNEINVDLFQKEAERILDECLNEIGWVYTTEHEHKIIILMRSEMVKLTKLSGLMFLCARVVQQKLFFGMLPLTKLLEK